jgi:hypothetical protein
MRNAQSYPQRECRLMCTRLRHPPSCWRWPHMVSAAESAGPQSPSGCATRAVGTVPASSATCGRHGQHLFCPQSAPQLGHDVVGPQLRRPKLKSSRQSRDRFNHARAADQLDPGIWNQALLALNKIRCLAAAPRVYAALKGDRVEVGGRAGMSVPRPRSSPIRCAQRIHGLAPHQLVPTCPSQQSSGCLRRRQKISFPSGRGRNEVAKPSSRLATALTLQGVDRVVRA